MYFIPDCPDCGGEPIISVIRVRTLIKHKLIGNDEFQLLADDLLGVYCSKCDQMIELTDPMKPEKVEEPTPVVEVKTRSKKAGL